ncbi:hypothetical protein Pmani_003289 [Petrolisthes manimaculis]|uniref:L-Fucosyltransferase n=1 Tax=Petrolisthes manimaculis TaxID=1843537 RepID=A0AAE1UPJ1_9EUCA|nr:hypothetical protein Pmani_003289 [Petrolisthes manimaculis]
MALIHGVRWAVREGDYLEYDEVFSNHSDIRWPILMFSTMGRLGNCLSSYATALTFHTTNTNNNDHTQQATIAVAQNIFKSVSRVMDRRHLALPVVGNELLLDVLDMGLSEVVRPDYLKDDHVSHLLPTINRAVNEYIKTGKEKLYLLEGYPNKMKMLADHHQTIRSHFKIRPDLQEKARSFLDGVRRTRGHDVVTFIGVHIRRGDYVNFMEKFHHCSVPSASYYHAALDHYRHTLHLLLPAGPPIVFVVCSDDLTHARHHLANHTDVVFSDLMEPEEDLALLAACSHSVMTVGSFGFWASYLAGGRVVYPLLRNCTHTPYVHPHSLGTRGYLNWLPLSIN